MAVIKPGPMISDIRGSINGVTFGRNRAGLFARQRVAPVQAPSARRTAVRNAVAYCQQYYRATLTAPQQAAWLGLGDIAGGLNALGDKIRLTGQQAFLRVNVIQRLAGNALIAAAPGPPFETSCPIPTCTVDHATGLILTAVAPALAAGDTLQVQIGNKVGTGRNFYKGPWATIEWLFTSTTFPHTLVAPAGLATGDRFHTAWRFINAVGRVSVTNYYTFTLT